jgi:hypothetical protein
MGAVWSTLVGEAEQEDGGDESRSRCGEDENDGGDLEELTHSEKYRLRRNKKAEQRHMDLRRDKQRDEDEMDNICVPGPGATGSGLICKLTVIETAWGRGLATTCPANVRPCIIYNCFYYFVFIIYLRINPIFYFNNNNNNNNNNINNN